MIVRIIVVDPRPRKAGEDIIVYQVPEKSRAMELLCETFKVLEIDHVVMEPKVQAKKEA